MQPSDVDAWLHRTYAEAPGVAWTVNGDGHAARVHLVYEDDSRLIGVVQSAFDLAELCGGAEYTADDPMVLLGHWTLPRLVQQHTLWNGLVACLHGPA